MVLLLVFCVFIVPSAFASDVTKICNGTIPLRRVPSTGEGTWWTVAATQASSGQCGINNNQAPCKCTGFQFSSNLQPPRIPAYNSTVFGYNETSSTYELQEAFLSLVDKEQPWAIFNFMNKASGSSTVVSALDTDDHETFIIFYMCESKAANGDPIVIVVSKSPAGLNETSQARVDEVLKKNNIDKDKLATFDPSDCPNVVTN